MHFPIKRIAADGLLTTFALILSYLESLLPIGFLIPVPGIRLGLPNLCVMLAFFLMGKGDAWILSLLRVVLSCLLFSSPEALLFSLCGALFSYAVLWMLSGLKKKEKISFLGLSPAAAAAHGIGQTLAACLLYRSGMFLLGLPLLIVFSALAGIFTGLLAELLLPRLKQILIQSRVLPENRHGSE